VLYNKEIENRLVNYNPNVNDFSGEENLMREEFEVETIKLESAKAFREYGGVKVRHSYLFFNSNTKI
jgi:hypothetical protein